MWRGAASISSQPRAREGLGRGPPGTADRLRAGGQGLSRVRPQRAGLLFRDVRGRHSARIRARNCSEAGDRAFAVLRTRCETLSRAMPPAKPPAGSDDGAAYLGALARHRLAVRARRCGTAHAADVGRRAAGSRGCWSICAASVCADGLSAVSGSDFLAAALTDGRRRPPM